MFQRYRVLSSSHFTFCAVASSLLHMFELKQNRLQKHTHEAPSSAFRNLSERIYFTKDMFESIIYN